MANQHDVEVWTDASTWPGNPGQGGFAAVLKEGLQMRVVSGFSPEHATNNYMETYAVMAGLRALKVACNVTIISDSQYVLRGLSAFKKKKFFKTNTELWEELYEYWKKHQVASKFVRGHVGVELNEWCNDLAGDAAINRTMLDFLTREVPQKYIAKAARSSTSKKKSGHYDKPLTDWDRMP